MLYNGLSKEVFDTTVVATDTRGDPGTVLLVTARQTVGGVGKVTDVGHGEEEAIIAG